MKRCSAVSPENRTAVRVQGSLLHRSLWLVPPERENSQRRVPAKFNVRINKGDIGSMLFPFGPGDLTVGFGAAFIAAAVAIADVGGGIAIGVKTRVPTI